jgi:hypothetical protein
MQQDVAETLALRALGWLAGNDELLPVFLNSTGASLSELRGGASDPTFLGAVLDFLLMDEAWIMAFCEAEKIAPDSPAAARAVLPGGASVHWT